MKIRLISMGLLFGSACLSAFGQAAPVVGVEHPASLFTDKDKTLNKNKQAAMHIVIDLLECNHWDEADKWLTEKYIQHNPQVASGLAPVLAFFKGRATPTPVPDPDHWKTKIVAVTTQGKDIVTVASRRELPDPRNPGQTYTTTHFDMWRFVDGKADEHWDEGTIPAPAPGGKGKGK